MEYEEKEKALSIFTKAELLELFPSLGIAKATTKTVIVDTILLGESLNAGNSEFDAAEFEKQFEAEKAECELRLEAKLEAEKAECEAKKQFEAEKEAEKQFEAKFKEAAANKKPEYAVVSAIKEDGVLYKVGADYLGKRVEKFLKDGQIIIKD